MSNFRDAAMARLAAARTSAGASVSLIDDCLTLFLDPSDDKSGDARKELLEILADVTGELSRSLEHAQVNIERMEREEFLEEEPDDDDEDTDSISEDD